jgi:tripartite-type tricarboxylate transporter receptor subunit TctC
MIHPVRLLLVSVLSCATSGVVAADTAPSYPNKPIRMIVPFVAGGPSDVLARMIGQKLTEKWGQPVIVENRGSAGGIFGFEICAKAVPDGHTMIIANGSGLTINPHVYLNLPYDPAKDFRPITQITSAAYILVVPISLPVKTLADYIALAKSKPGQLNFASTSTNTLLAAEQLNYMAGIKTVAVNYKGTGQAMTSVIGGEVQSFIVSPLVAVAQIKAGKIRALGVTGLKRSPALPDVPAIAETVPGYENIVWHSVLLPAKTPDHIVAKITTEVISIVKQPDVRERFASQGLDAVGSTPEQLSKLIKEETAMYGKLVKQIGLQPQ